MKNIFLMITLALSFLITPSVFADHPRINEMSLVYRLAQDVEISSTRLHRMAREAAHHGTRHEARALSALYRLEIESRDFRRQVANYRRNPVYTERDFVQLVNAFYRAAAAMNNLHGYAYINRSFRRVDITMARLMDYYGGNEIFESYRSYDDDHDDFDYEDFDDDYDDFRRR